MMQEGGLGERSFGDKTLSEVADYWNARPCNIRHSALPVGTKEYFDEVERRKYFVEPHIPKFAEFGRWAGKKVLEVGCGIGTDTISFARNGAAVTAVDISTKSLDMTAQRAKVFGLADRIRLVQADAEHLSDYVAPEAYDLVYSFGVIHHTPHPDRAIAQLREFMDTASILKIMVYNRISWKVLCMLLSQHKNPFGGIDRIIAKHSEAQEGCPITYTYTKSSVRRLLQGMSVRSIRIDHIFPYDVQKYVQYEYTLLPIFKMMPRPVFRMLERHFGWHICVEAKIA